MDSFRLCAESVPLLPEHSPEPDTPLNDSANRRRTSQIMGYGTASEGYEGYDPYAAQQ